MANKFFGATSLTGGGTGALDAIDGSILSDGDIADVTIAASDTLVKYTLSSASGAVESSPVVIAPDSNAGTKRWVLVKITTKDGIDIYDGTNIGHVQFSSNELELYSERHSGIVKVMVEDAAGNKETAAKFSGAGASELYYDNSKKFETTTSGGTLTGTLVTTAGITDSSSYSLGSRPNSLINGEFRIGQRGVSFTSATTPANNDDTFLLDRWLLLADGNDIVDVTRSTTVPATGFLNSIALDVETANKKFGIVQILENKDSADLIGRTVTFSFYAQVSATTKLDNIKAAIITWSSTADSVTSDIVSNWNTEGTNPTLAANWTYENTPANLSVTTTFARYSVTAAVDTASAANVGVFIWSDVTDTTTGHFVYITGCKLEVGAIMTDYIARPIENELSLCQRYYEKSYALDVYPGSIATDGQGGQYAVVINDIGRYPFLVRKRSSGGTLTFYSPNSGTADRYYNNSAAADQTLSAQLAAERTVQINTQATAGQYYSYQWVYDAEL